MNNTQDRRAKPRSNCDYAAIVEGLDGNGNIYNDQGRLVNLSASGLFMLVNRDIESGAAVSITIFLSDPVVEVSAPRLSTNGTVVRKEQRTDGSCGVAVKFNNYQFL